MKTVLGPTEIIFLLGFACMTIGVALLSGAAWGLIVAGAILLVAAFRNARERDNGIGEKGK